MNGKTKATALGCVAVLMLSAAVCCTGQGSASSTSIAPGKMAKIGTIDERFQSYNIEAVEVTGGRFWKPFAKPGDPKPADEKSNAASSAPAGIDPSLFEYRKPIDLSNRRLRKLATALGPAYVRVSGTWMNSTYFQDSDAPAPVTPPNGFNSVLTRQQWKGVVDFSKAVDAKVVTSFATSMGTRDTAGVWTPDQAQRFVAYTKSIGGSIAAAEFMNEPNMPAGGGTPATYDAKAYGKDIDLFHAFVKKALPDTVFLGPGAAGEGTLIVPGAMRMLASADLLAATGPAFDAISYHSYGAVSSRCGMFGRAATTSAEAALSKEWLARSEQTEEFYRGLRDRFESGKPMWNTETAQAACGGDRWAAMFLDSFRYLNQLGILAQKGVQVHLHNTLASSDYGLLDEKTYTPRPNYWAALMWRKLMGTTVLDPGSSPSENLHLYAQCLRDKPGGVTLLAINADKTGAQTISIPTGAERYTLTSADLLSSSVELNGSELKLGAGDALPKLKGTTVHGGQVTFAPASITFLALPKADNASCK